MLRSTPAGLADVRSSWAFYATLAGVALFLMEGETRPESVMFIDADTWFFSDTAPLFGEMGEASIGLSPHRFSGREPV